MIRSNQIGKDLSERTLKLWQHSVIFLLACVVVIVRRPDAITHAQLFAEDGHIWLADANNLGPWISLFRTYVGYFVLLPRLAASLALLVPLSSVPLFFNLIAIPIQALPVNLLIASRSSAWGNIRFRACMACAYITLPNCTEVSCGITDANWLLVVSAFLLLVASTPQRLTAKVFDISVLVLSGLTGPFAIFLLPISIFLALRGADRWRWIASYILGACSIVQGWALLSGARSDRPHSTLGATPEWLVRILSGQIFLGTIFGGSYISLANGNKWFAFLACVAIAGIFITTLSFFNSRIGMKLFLIFAWTILGASLIAPWVQPPKNVTVWRILAATPQIHYWFLPELAFAWSILYCFTSPNRLTRTCAITLIPLMLFGIIRDWRHPAFPDEHFPDYVRRFEAAPDGATVTFPLYPEGWTMRLVKHHQSR